ncbi:MAG: hypothetical protein ACK4N5_16330, partial [Myxococcales bacterium]
MKTTAAALTVLAISICPGPARAQYGAHVAVTLDVGEVREKEEAGIKSFVHDATITWSGGCTRGNNPSYQVKLEGTGPTTWDSGLLFATSLGIAGTHKMELAPGRVYQGKAWVECNDSQGNETARAETGKKALAPRITGMGPILRSTPPEFFHCLPLDVEVMIAPLYENSIVDGEQMRLDVTGAGTAYARTFNSEQEFSESEIRVKATAAGKAQLTLTKLPYGLQSNVFELPTGTHAACLNTPGGQQPDPNPGTGSDPGADPRVEQDGRSGCSAAGGAPQLLLL